MKAPMENPPRKFVARRKKLLLPLLHPIAGRKLPQDLQPEAVFRRAQGMSGGVRDPELLRLIHLIDQGPYHGDTRIQPYFDGESAFRDMLGAVGQARQEVLVESYIISADSTGEQFVAALRDAVSRGVCVFVLADAFGSLGTRPEFWDLLRDSGSQFRLFRRPRYAAPVSLMPIFDHRKLLVVDREMAFTGGMNIGDEYHRGTATQKAWRDTHVRVTGAIAWECALLFEESWAAAGGDPLPSQEKMESGQTGAQALLLDSRPGRGAHEVYSAFAAIMGASRERLWITNAYFAPSRRVLRFLKATARRGVDVRLLVPRFSDVPIIQAATRGYYAELFACGVRVYEYLPAKLHAKTLVADDWLCIIGSTNFDFRSFELNHEANILSPDDELGRTLHEQFLRDLDNAEEMIPRRWLHQNWCRRLLGRLARLLAPFL